MMMTQMTMQPLLMLTPMTMPIRRSLAATTHNQSTAVNTIHNLKQFYSLIINKQGSFITGVLSAASASGNICVQSSFNFCIFASAHFRIAAYHFMKGDDPWCPLANAYE